ncbi:MAG: hypothetical protein PVI90_00145 [Desulfobacteraceae bacterium]|jgi:hypothetical protein
MLKNAYIAAGSDQALKDLGLSDTEKIAVWSTLARIGSKALIRPAMWAGRKSLTSATKPISWLGQKALGQVNKISPRAAQFLQNAGRNISREAAGGALLTGTMNAAMAEPGNRLSAFGRGFAGGALGGAAFGMGSNIGRMGLGKTLGTQQMANLYRAGRHGWFGGFRGPQGALRRGFKGLGAKTITTGIPFAIGTGASFLPPTFEG